MKGYIDSILGFQPGPSFEDDEEEIYDSYERVFEHDSIPRTEIRDNLEVIGSALRSYRCKSVNDIDRNDANYYPRYGSCIREEKFQKYVRPLKEFLKKEFRYYELARILKQFDYHSDIVENYLSIVGGRIGFIEDVLAGDYNYYGETGKTYGISELNDLSIREYSLRRLSQDELNKTCNLLENALKKFFDNYILQLYSKCDEIIEKYDFIKDEFDYYRLNNIEGLQLLLKSKDYLILLGIDEKEVDEKLNKISTFFKRFEKKDEEKLDDMIRSKKSAMEFYSTVLSDGETIRKNAEIVNENPFTDEEWIEKLKDLNFMKKVLEQLHIDNNKLYNHDLSDGEFTILLDVLKKLWDGTITSKQVDSILFEFIDEEYSEKVQHEDALHDL